VFDELFDPEGLRVAYITIAAHMRGYRCTRIHTHTHTHTHTQNTHTHTHTHTQHTHTHTYTYYVHRILDPSALKCRTRARTANASRAYERMSAIMPARYLAVGRSVGRSVGRLASANSPCKITMEQIRARSSRLPKRSSRRAEITSDR